VLDGVSCDTRMVDAERMELAALLAGTATGASLATTPSPRLDPLSWATREAELTSRFTGIIRSLETVVAEQKLMIAKMALSK
jgi:hypothetical protein